MTDNCIVSYTTQNLMPVIYTHASYRYTFLLTVYVIEVYTGDKAGAGTDAHVFVTLFGKGGQTPKTQLISRSVSIAIHFSSLT